MIGFARVFTVGGITVVKPGYRKVTCSVSRFLWLVLLVFVAYEPCFGMPLEDPEEKYKAYMPMGEDFPGTVSSDAERVTETFSFQLKSRDLSPLRMELPPRHQISTGLYRVPGEPITIEQKSLSYDPWGQWPRVRIGAHSVIFTEHDPEQLKRVGRATDRFQLREGVQQDRDRASGLIYIESDENGSDSFDITISGAVRAPWFKLGRDTPEQWRNDIRHYPAPWAELEGKYSVLALPSAMVRDLEDPTPIINFYDQVIQRAHALTGLSDNDEDERDRAPDNLYRFTIDVQQWRHSLATASVDGFTLYWLAFNNPFRWLDSNDPMVFDVLFHEVGHSLEPVHFLFEPPGATEAFADLIVYGNQYRRGYWFLGDRIESAGFIFLSDAAHNGAMPSLMWLLASFVEYFHHGYDPRIWAENSKVMESWKGAFMIQLVNQISDDFIQKLYRTFRHTPEHLLPAKDNQQEKTD
ncbi:M60 family metallopeptidase, partial [Sansalvadorimonas verongulae]|uniref:M60 family metallopeptidase n=2 Tax=Sansalvadorimonas verongulae TaxID=2172824 RepID=UPI001E4BFDD9